MIVYRLENYKGKGPFSGSQGMALQLISHKDPTTMLEDIGLSVNEFESVTDKGVIFGWRSAELMRKFFRNSEKASCRASEMKFKITEYEVDSAIEFPDGQVLFVRPDSFIRKISVRDFLD